MFALGIRYLNGWVAATQVNDFDQVEWPPHPGRIFMAMAAAHFQESAPEAEQKALEWLESLDAPEVFASDCRERPTVTSFVPVNPRLVDEKEARAKEKRNKKRPPPPLQSAHGFIRTRQPRTFARAWLENENVFLVWPHDNATPEIAESLAKICGRVTRIGHSISFVQVRVVEKPEWENQSAKLQKWIPNDAQAKRKFRVWEKGTLDYLRKQYNGVEREEYGRLKIEAEHPDKKLQKQAKVKLKEKYNNQQPGMHPNLSSLARGYAWEDEKSAVSAPGTVFDEKRLIILRLRRESGDYRSLGVISTLRVTSALQKALIKTASDWNIRLPEEISGHKADKSPSERPHLALLPLAYVASEHADGRLMGLALALPKQESPYADIADIRRILLKCLAKMRGKTIDSSPQLKLGKLGVWNLDGITEDRPPFNLLASTWTASHQGETEWGTVTPIVLDRHPKAKAKDIAEYRAEVAKTIRTACERVLYSKTPEKEAPKIVHVAPLPVSPHLGAPPSHSFPKMERKSGGQCCHTHALIEFDKPIVGPLLVGAGRYRGYGFCRPMRRK